MWAVPSREMAACGTLRRQAVSNLQVQIRSGKVPIESVKAG